MPNEDMAAAWDGGGEGEHWAANADRYDESVRAYHARLFDAAAIDSGDAVLDLGCGTGQTTRDAARAAASGRALGVDLSGPMLAVARDRGRAEGLTNVEFLQADAQVHAFEPGAFDVVISRFGAMFFDDPTAAFTNLARAQRRGGRLALLAWQELAANVWLSTIRGALAMGRELPTPPANAPGPFGLADASYTAKVLGAAGYTDVDLTPVTEQLRLGGDSADAYAFVSTIGPVKGMLEGLGPDEQREALDTLRATLEAHHSGDGVALGSAAWLITGRVA
jgi:SAM-dependent methyltransferase